MENVTSMCNLQIKTDQHTYLERYAQNRTLFLYDENGILVTSYDMCGTFGDMLVFLNVHDYPIYNKEINEIRRQIYDHNVYMNYNIVYKRDRIQYLSQKGGLTPIYRSQQCTLHPRTIL